MVARSRAFPCDDSRLRSFLDDSLPELEHAKLTDHLDTCSGCRRALERLAGGSRLWAELPQLAPSAAEEATVGTSPRRGPTPEHDHSLDFLGLAESPGTLGLLGPYEVTEVLGRGGFGVVLRAFDPGLGRAVAIKVLAPQLATSAAARSRFAREAKAAAAVVHDHVVAIHAVDSWNGLPYLVMPYVAGCSLQERVDRDGPLGVKEVLRIGMQTALGLTAAHAQGLVHRDVKPSNILLENGVERVKLTDFGLARAVDDASLTQSGVVAGTPQYMSPEQALGESIDHRSDLFSLGSVLYFICAGHPPFRANSTPAILRRVSDDRPRPLRDVNPEIPIWLAEIVERLHGKDPAARFQTAAEVVEVMGGYLSLLQRGRPIETPQPKTLPSTPLRSGRKRTAAGVALCSVALVALAWAAEWTGFSRQATGNGRDSGVQIITNDSSHPQVIGSGNVASKTWPIADFTSIIVESTFRAEVTQATGFKVITSADDNVLEDVRVVKEGSTLRIGLAPGKSFRLKSPLKAEITLPALDGLDLSGASKTTFRGFKSDKSFKLKASGASEAVGTIDAGSADFQMSGASTAVVTGSGKEGRLSLNGASRLQLTEFALKHCQAELGGASNASITVRSDQPFKAHLSGASNLNGLVQATDLDLVLDGASTVTLQGDARNGKLSVESASHLKLSGLTLDADHLIVAATGASSVKLKGKCRAAVLEAAGASHLDLDGLVIDAADVKLSGASHAKLDVQASLKYDVSSVSGLRYSGNPAKLVGKKLGGATISPRLGEHLTEEAAVQVFP
jgi:eukaryotic-like serine/threonine-protein kinase